MVVFLLLKILSWILHEYFTYQIIVIKGFFHLMMLYSNFDEWISKFWYPSFINGTDTSCMQSNPFITQKFCLFSANSTKAVPMSFVASQALHRPVSFWIQAQGLIWCRTSAATICSWSSNAARCIESNSASICSMVYSMQGSLKTRYLNLREASYSGEP